MYPIFAHHSTRARHFAALNHHELHVFHTLSRQHVVFQSLHLITHVFPGFHRQRGLDRIPVEERFEAPNVVEREAEALANQIERSFATF